MAHGFRSLIDNALTSRDPRHFTAVLTVLVIGALAASFASLQRRRLFAHLQSQIVSDIRFQVATLAFGAWLAFRGSMTIGTLAAFQALSLSVSNSLLYFLEFTRSLLPARAGMQRIDEFLAEPTTLTDRAGASRLAPFERAIEVRQVDVLYGWRLRGAVAEANPSRASRRA